MKPLYYLLKWLLIFMFFSLLVGLCITYFIFGCSKTEWINFLVESGDISFAILPVTGLVAGFILVKYALKQMYLFRFKCYPKPKPQISRTELRDLVMSGELNKDEYRDWFTTRFNP